MARTKSITCWNECEETLRDQIKSLVAVRLGKKAKTVLVSVTSRSLHVSPPSLSTPCSFPCRATFSPSSPAVTFLRCRLVSVSHHLISHLVVLSCVSLFLRWVRGRSRLRSPLHVLSLATLVSFLVASFTTITSAFSRLTTLPRIFPSLHAFEPRFVRDWKAQQILTPSIMLTPLASLLASTSYSGKESHESQASLPSLFCVIS